MMASPCHDQQKDRTTNSRGVKSSLSRNTGRSALSEKPIPDLFRDSNRFSGSSARPPKTRSKDALHSRGFSTLGLVKTRDLVMVVPMLIRGLLPMPGYLE
jgi:hypothetical protein